MSTSVAFTALRNLLLSLAVLILFDGCRQPDPSTELEPLFNAYVRAWNTGDFTSLQNVVSADFELRMAPHFEPLKGLDSLKSTIAFWRKAYPDFTITIKEMVYSKDKIAARWTIHAADTGQGTHPPTGKSIDMGGMSILHISGGKIVDEWIIDTED